MEPTAGEVATVDTDTGEADGASTYREAGGEGAARGGSYCDTVAQAGGPVLAVFGIERSSEPDGATVVVTGSHPVAFCLLSHVVLGGLILAAAALGGAFGSMPMASSRPAPARPQVRAPGASTPGEIRSDS